eukprot:15483349-Alexandrium_andersonii.AAC.1
MVDRRGGIASGASGSLLPAVREHCGSCCARPQSAVVARARGAAAARRRRNATATERGRPRRRLR